MNKNSKDNLIKIIFGVIVIGIMILLSLYFGDINIEEMFIYGR